MLGRDKTPVYAKLSSNFLKWLILNRSEKDVLEFEFVMPEILKNFSNSNVERYENIVSLLPNIIAEKIKLNEIIQIEKNSVEFDLVNFKQILMGLKPWRKGPFDLFGVKIDTEWRSDMKWARFAKKLPSLENKNILDVGCGSGYYMFRMLKQRPRVVIGLDPSQLSLYQFYAVNKYIDAHNLFYLPLRLEQFSGFDEYFDFVFSMGVIYHQKSPIEHLKRIRKLLKFQGMVVLETLIYPSEEMVAFVPQDRYAKMRNVYFIPTVLCLKNWAYKAGFRNFELISLEKTTFEEQRKTEWMNFDSLVDFLDPLNNEKTIEGYFAPYRGVFFLKV